MENPEEILHSLEEFSKMKPKDIPRELEEYLCFVAKTGNPVYQWQTIKSLFREKLLSVITEFYESCPSMEIPPCPNVEMFNYDLMKNFILEKLDTFAAAPFTVQRICELLTTPRKEYNRIDKYMRALEKNILVVSTTEPGRRSTENGESIMNGIESEHMPESSSCHDINVEEMDDSPVWPKAAQVAPVLFETNECESQAMCEAPQGSVVQESFESANEQKLEIPSSSTSTPPLPLPQAPPQQETTVITCRTSEEPQQPYVSIEPVPLHACTTSRQENTEDNRAEDSVTITAVPAGVQQRRSSVERITAAGDSDSGVEEGGVKENKSEVSKPNLPESEATTLPKDQVSPVVTSTTEVTEEPSTETKAGTDEVALVIQQEQHEPVSGIENISPENSSSSPEVLQVDINSEPEKNLPEIPIILPDNVVLPEILPKVKEDDTEQPPREKDTSVEQAETPKKSNVGLKCEQDFKSNEPPAIEEEKEADPVVPVESSKSPTLEKPQESESTSMCEEVLIEAIEKISKENTTEENNEERGKVPVAEKINDLIDEPVAESVDKPIVEAIKEPVAKPDEEPIEKIIAKATAESVVVKENKSVDVPNITEVPETKEEETEETPMEVDIVSEVEMDKKGDSVSNEASASGDSAL